MGFVGWVGGAPIFTPFPRGGWVWVIIDGTASGAILAQAGGRPPPAASLVRGNETVRKYPTRPLVSWGVDVWEKRPGSGKDSKNPTIQCGWEAVGGR